MAELKPCPFCGGELTLWRRECSNGVETTYLASRIDDCWCCNKSPAEVRGCQIRKAMLRCGAIPTGTRRDDCPFMPQEKTERGETTMTNKKMFDIANESADARIKKVVRDSFLDWCLKNGRTPLGDFSFQDWCKEEWKGEA